jgi:hypothetical protein
MYSQIVSPNAYWAYPQQAMRLQNTMNTRPNPWQQYINNTPVPLPLLPTVSAKENIQNKSSVSLPRYGFREGLLNPMKAAVSSPFSITLSASILAASSALIIGTGGLAAIPIAGFVCMLPALSSLVISAYSGLASPAGKQDHKSLAGFHLGSGLVQLGIGIGVLLAAKPLLARNFSKYTQLAVPEYLLNAFHPQSITTAFEGIKNTDHAVFMNRLKSTLGL